MVEEIIDRLEIELGPARRAGLVVREVEDADLARAAGAGPPRLKNLRPTHHTLARLLAKGVKQVDVSAITGFSQSRISILKTDPAFQELLAHYETQVEEISVELMQKVKLLAGDALAEIHSRLEERPEEFSNSALLALVTATLDRSGVGPKSVQEQHHHHHLGAAELETLKRTAQEVGKVSRLTPEGPTPPLLEGTVVEVEDAAQSS